MQRVGPRRVKEAIPAIPMFVGVSQTKVATRQLDPADLASLFWSVAQLARTGGLQVVPEPFLEVLLADVEPLLCFSAAARPEHRALLPLLLEAGVDFARAVSDERGQEKNGQTRRERSHGAITKVLEQTSATLYRNRHIRR